MKIGFDAKRFFHNKTGLGNYSRDLIRILSTHYPKNTYFLYNPKHSFSYISHSYNTKEIVPSGFWKKIKSLWRSIGIGLRLKKDNIKIFHGLSGEIPFFIPKHIKKIVTIHDLIFLRYPKLYNSLDRYIYYLKFKYAAQKADKIVAISQQTKKDIITYLKIPEDKIIVIYQGCADVFKKEYSDSEKQRVKEKFGLKNNFILNVGTIEETKNALQIVKAIENIDTTLVLIGRKTEYFEKIKKYCTEKKYIDDKIIHLENVSFEELAIIYQLATIFIYPSIFEGFGIPIIEALYSKTPVITTNSGVFPEAGGPNSIYVNPNNTNEITRQIILLLQNENLRKEIIEKGYQYAQQFSDSKIADEIQNLYKNLITIS